MKITENDKNYASTITRPSEEIKVEWQQQQGHLEDLVDETSRHNFVSQDIINPLKARSPKQKKKLVIVTKRLKEEDKSNICYRC